MLLCVCGSCNFVCTIVQSLIAKVVVVAAVAAGAVVTAEVTADEVGAVAPSTSTARLAKCTCYLCPVLYLMLMSHV